jgi:hypothetical protein
MARAYIVLARNDLDDNLLQVLDLKPNATPSKDSRVYAPIAQGGYQTFYLLDGVNAAVVTQAGAAGGASLDIDGDVYGLSAYLIDRVEDTGGGESLTAAEAVTISGLIEAAASAGTALTLALINVAINTPAGVAGSDLDGTLGASTGTVEEVLRILAGERFKMTDNAQVRLVGGGFDTAQRGFFVQQPNVEVPASVDGVYGDVRGRRSTAPMTHIRPGEPRTAPVQTGAQDTNFNRVRQTVETGHLHLSATDGVLAELKSATFTWLNPGNAYTAAAVTAATPRALTLAAANIPATGVFRAITIYDAEGNVI